MRSKRLATRRSSSLCPLPGASSQQVQHGRSRPRTTKTTARTMLVSSWVLWLTRRNNGMIRALVFPIPKRLPWATRNRAVESPYHGPIGVGRRPFSSRPSVAYKNLDDNNEIMTAPKDHAGTAEDHLDQPQPQLFRVTAPYAPTGDQPQAIAQLLHQLQTQNDKYSILQGITGTGKTLVMSHMIAALQRPTLVLCHNKTLAAQLARELRSFLQDNAVELFVSYYNHYLPESYQEATGKYIAKKSSVNAEIDALRHRATRALLMRRDVVVVASVSCIFGLGLPSEYLDHSLALHVGITTLPTFDDWLEQLNRMLYTESYSDDEFERGQYQLVHHPEQPSKTIVLWPPHERFPIQIRLAPVSSTADDDIGDEDENDDKNENENTPYTVTSIQMGRQNGLHPVASTHIFPARHHVSSSEQQEAACQAIETELRERVQELTAQGKRLEAERLQQRTVQDLMMIRETGFCNGAENYSRHFAGRPAGAPPTTLLDYLGKNDDDAAKQNSNHRDWLLLIDESHVTLPQLSAMYAGDQARKRRLVQHGYRLPSALDNRPLSATEFWDRVPQTLFVSATPGKTERELAKCDPVEMVIRPTFVPDPVLLVRSSEGQLEDLRIEIAARVPKGQRTLAVTVSKRDAEDLASYLIGHDINATYIHSGLTTHERSDALKALQSGEVDCLVGVNLLREGLDLPQVSLVAILSADCEGFLRSETSLLQTVGRAARNIDGTAIFYAKRITASMQRCIDATKRRREKQLEYIRENQCEVRTTEGSSMMSIFDLSKDEIDAELALELMADGSDEKRQRFAAARAALENPVFEASLKLHVDTKVSAASIDVDHVPSSPGCYFWRDGNGAILYIGKAAKLRSRVKSYLSGSRTKHSSRIQRMLQKARSVDFMLTPSERDALVLESNLIKHHQPPYNVLLKDDEHYPYICASSGDSFPRLFVTPSSNKESTSTAKYRYFGPYTSFREINAILDGVEEKYGLRQLSFEARHGAAAKEDYKRLFETVLDEVFGNIGDQSLQLMEKRKEYEEAGLLFESDYNQCRDVVVTAKASEDTRTVVVHVSQLRQGLVAGQFSYACDLPRGAGEEDVAEAIQMVLEQKHYPAGANTASEFSWFPDDILLSHESIDTKSLRSAILSTCSGTVRKQKKKITIGTAVASGPRQDVDARLLRFASGNAEQAAIERSMGSVKCLVDGSSAAELATIIGSAKSPSRIECYDVSHSQGEKAVASRVVFVDGRPAPMHYRKFNIKTVQGVDDYASLAEVLERRFRRLDVSSSHNNGDDDPWCLPDLVVIDGGPGQLNAAIRGMARAGVTPANCVQPAEDSDLVDLVDGGVISMASVAVCSLAKREEQVFVPGSSLPVNDTPNSPAVLLLRALRNESHRFALKSHISRRRLNSNNK